MNRVLLLVGGALMLGGATNAAGAPAVNDGYDWAMRVDEDGGQSAVLAYEVDGTDDQPLAFICDKGTNSIAASISGNSPDLTAITLVSGDVKLRVTGKTDAEDIPYFSSEEIPGGSPLISAFAANGWLRMTDGNGTTDMAGTASGKQAIAHFVHFCLG